MGTDDERLECSRKWKVNVQVDVSPDGMLINALGKLNVSFFLWLSVKCFATSRIRELTRHVNGTFTDRVLVTNSIQGFFWTPSAFCFERNKAKIVYGARIFIIFPID